MGQATSASAVTAQEERMKTRIRQTIGTLADFGLHVQQANDWAKLCPTPKTCHLSFRVVVSERISVELLPYVWKIRGNVHIEVRKLRRRDDTSMPSILNNSSVRHIPNVDDAVVGHAKLLTVHQFYYIYCFLADIKACAAHTVQFPDKDSLSGIDPEFDETECQICMDKKKQVVLPCSHSFCLSCFQHWSAQNSTCPICRSKVECSEGSDLWQLMHHEVRDLNAYATDLVARIFEYLDKRDRSTVGEDAIKRSKETIDEASALKYTPLNKLLQVDLAASSNRLLPLGLSTLLGHMPAPTEVDSDFLLALELSAGEDQFEAFRQYDQLRRDQVLAMTLAMEVDDDDDDENRDPLAA